jgi:hypothetical protein
MAKVKGYQVTVSGVNAGSEQSCSLTIQNNLQEEEVKDATNPLSPPQEKVSGQWSIQQQCKLDTAAAVKALIQAACGTSAIAVSMAAAGATFSGNAYVSDLTIQAPNRAPIVSQATYSGNGPITKATN